MRLEVTYDEMATFHTNVDSHVVLSNERRTAQRILEGEEFGEADGIIFSAKPLRDDQLFEVQIDRKAVGWIFIVNLNFSSCYDRALVKYAEF